ncbi:hypothetical protein [Yoonia sp. R2-816]|uniref:hypothetical protein n=1 Tax=Yoonia sp. R2-816 TaxID=3342638 RepID=UPI0037281432
MSKLPPVGALWIGGSLTWLEQLCLKSFVAHGHETTLFTYNEVKGVPDGVIIRDGREIVDTGDFVKHARTESVALFSDLFRFHMIQKTPGIIYVDTDVYCLRPLDIDEPNLFGYESMERDRGRLNGAVLRLAPESPLLSEMLSFMEDEYPEPTWLSPAWKRQMAERRAGGDPVHVSEMPWGIWGPLGITNLARSTGEAKHAKPPEFFYPVHFKERISLFKRPMKVERFLTENSYTIHMWAPIKRYAGKRYDGLCPPRSYIGHQLALHGIDPAKAPTTHWRVVSYD